MYVSSPAVICNVMFTSCVLVVQLIFFNIPLQKLEELFALQLEQENAYGLLGTSPLPPDLCELPAHIPPCSYSRGSTRSSLSSVSAD